MGKSRKKLAKNRENWESSGENGKIWQIGENRKANFDPIEVQNLHFLMLVAVCRFFRRCCREDVF